MKKLLLIFLMPLFISFSDGDSARWMHVFKYYDPSSNTVYISVATKMTVNADKKPKLLDVTNSIAVYNIEKDVTKYIFKDDFPELIEEFIFEEKFNFNNNSIKLNTENSDDKYYYSQHCIHNIDLPSREPSSKLIIRTLSITSQLSTLWLCDKDGTDLEKIHEFKEDEKYYFDTKGRNILIIKEADSKIEVKKLKY